jgi:rhamnose utilization protein RhaD (predicted bifunctional aldolase and dehydrogenase)
LNNFSKSVQIEVRLATLFITADSEIAPLLDLSARLGSNPLLVQAGTGNTSVKVDGVLWIKASGKWLAHAGQDEILVPVDLAETRRCVQRDADPAGQYSLLCGKPLRTSVETAMHSVLPHRVVLHVHSVNTIAWAVRRDAASLLAERFAGLRWKWIPYVPSGLPLAREIERATACSPETNVLVLANHGLVVCGDNCEAAEQLLLEVEARVAIAPRPAPEPDCRVLMQLAGTSGWRLPDDPSVHALGTDAGSGAVLSRGVLYPCQAIFLSPHMRVSPRSTLAASPQPANPFLIIEGLGVVVSEKITVTACATLTGLAHVLQRIDGSAPIRYLNEPEVENVLSFDTYRYRELVETNSACGRAVFAS